MHQSYCIKVVLDELMYPVWRTLLIPGNIDLDKLHEMIQAAFGWLNENDYAFYLEEIEYSQSSSSALSAYGIPEIITKRTPVSTQKQLSEVLKVGQTLCYLYDFNDKWVHKISIEEVIQSARPLKHVKCIAGSRHRPPESVGGVSGYEAFLSVALNPKDPRYYEVLEWAEKDTGGRKFDPEYFYILEINRRLALF